MKLTQMLREVKENKSIQFVERLLRKEFRGDFCSVDAPYYVGGQASVVITVHLSLGGSKVTPINLYLEGDVMDSDDEAAIIEMAMKEVTIVREYHAERKKEYLELIKC